VYNVILFHLLERTVVIVSKDDFVNLVEVPFSCNTT
jgi:hypothetical protein